MVYNVAIVQIMSCVIVFVLIFSLFTMSAEIFE